MEVFVFLRNLDRPLLYPDASLQLELLTYLNTIGVVKFLEFFGPKYCTMLLYIVPSDRSQFPLSETGLEINKQRYASKIFFEYRQFKNFIVNLEKRFVLISVHRQAPVQPFEAVERQIGKYFLSKVNEGKNYMLADPELVLSQYRGIVLPSSLEEEIAKLHVDSSLEDLFILEANDKKICLTNRKLQLLSRNLPEGTTIYRIRLFERLVEKMVFLPRIRKTTMLYNHFEKPTSKVYHGVHQKLGPRNNPLEKAITDVYYRFNAWNQ